MIDDVFWTLHLKNQNPVTAQYDMANERNRTRGDSATFEFHFPNQSDDLTIGGPSLTVTDSYTILDGTTEQYQTVTVQSGATLTVDGTLRTGELTVDGTLTGSGQVNVVSTVDTYTVAASTAEIYDTVTVKQYYELVIDGTLQANEVDNNGTIDNNGTLRTVGSGGAISKLLAYDDFAGKYSLLEMLNGIQKYREQIPSDAVDSIVIGIEPSQTLKNRNITGVWAIIDDITDTRPAALSDTRLEFSVTILAEYSEYDDHSALEADLNV